MHVSVFPLKADFDVTPIIEGPLQKAESFKTRWQPMAAVNQIDPMRLSSLSSAASAKATTDWRGPEA
jgi:hypothetical protein